jgi:hypothetical protein
MRILSAFAPMVALSIGVALAAPASALAAHGVHLPHNPVVHMHRFAKARAYAPALLWAVPAKDTDGLSRNPEDCNMGCVDNGH